MGRSLFLILLVPLCLSCTLANRSKWKNNRVAEEQSAERLSLPAGKGDAYLFDLKITNQGRKNSVRLDLYWNEDSLGLYARGYLGKGVLKGLVTADSVLVFFPTNNEFYTGQLSGFITEDCFENLSFEKIIIDLFGNTPDKIDYPFGEAYLTILEEKPGGRKYRLVAKNCDEYFEIEYDRKKGRFIIDQLSYNKEDGSFKLEAKRRKYRLNIGLPPEKFQVEIPQTATRIYP